MVYLNINCAGNAWIWKVEMNWRCAHNKYFSFLNYCSLLVQSKYIGKKVIQKYLATRYMMISYLLISGLLAHTLIHLSFPYFIYSNHLLLPIQVMANALIKLVKMVKILIFLFCTHYIYNLYNTRILFFWWKLY